MATTSYIIKADGTKVAMPEPAQVDKDKGKVFSLGQLQQAVGGYIERVPPHSLSLVPEGYSVLVDEEGMMKELPFNSVASLFVGTPVSGDVVIISNLEWR
jgi:hypothetical protein